MFWAAFGYGLRTQLVPMEGDPLAPKGGVTARVYQTVLDRYLLPILGFRSIFMQDNAPVHKARIVQEWFRDIGIELVDWPPYSPDLNPIENLWKILKAKIIEPYPELTTMKNNDTIRAFLIQAAQEAWDLIGDELLNKLASEMQKRVDAIKATNS